MQAEVAQVGMLALAVANDENVARLDVPMHEPRSWAVERGCDLRQERDRSSGVQSADLVQDRAQVSPIDVAHGDEQHPVGFSDRVDRDDVRVLERRGELRFTQEPLAEPGSRASSGSMTSTPPDGRARRRAEYTTPVEPSPIGAHPVSASASPRRSWVTRTALRTGATRSRMPRAQSMIGTVPPSALQAAPVT